MTAAQWRSGRRPGGLHRGRTGPGQIGGATCSGRASGLASPSRQHAGPRRAFRARRGSIAGAAAVFACLGFVAATTGPWRGVAAGLQAALVPDGAAQGMVRGLVVSVSIGLLLSARGLARRQHRAWTAAVALCSRPRCCSSFATSTCRRPSSPAVLLVGLWHWRAEFYAAATARRPARALAAAALALAIVFAYGVAALIWHATSAHLAWSLPGP